MHYIYVDVTSGLILGLLDASFNWVVYKESNEKKPSEVIHREIHELISTNKVDKNNLEYFFSSGPGSYTGMRLGEGIAQILEWNKATVYSFHQFEVPQLMGIQKGFWMTNAFKGQLFIYSWDSEKSTIELINTTDVSVTNENLGYTLSQDNELFKNLITSKSMIAKEPAKFFKKIKELKMRKQPYYFRTLEEEFKQC